MGFSGGILRMDSPDGFSGWILWMDSPGGCCKGSVSGLRTDQSSGGEPVEFFQDRLIPLVS